MWRPRDKGKKAASRAAAPRNHEDRTRTTTMKNTKKNGKMTIRAELVGSPVEEWTEFRVYMGKKMVASFGTEEKALAFVKRAA